MSVINLINNPNHLQMKNTINEINEIDINSNISLIVNCSYNPLEAISHIPKTVDWEVATINVENLIYFYKYIKDNPIEYLFDEIYYLIHIFCTQFPDKVNVLAENIPTILLMIPDRAMNKTPPIWLFNCGRNNIYDNYLNDILYILSDDLINKKIKIDTKYIFHWLYYLVEIKNNDLFIRIFQSYFDEVYSNRGDINYHTDIFNLDSSRIYDGIKDNDIREYIISHAIMQKGDKIDARFFLSNYNRDVAYLTRQNILLLDLFKKYGVALFFNYRWMTKLCSHLNQNISFVDEFISYMDNIIMKNDDKIDIRHILSSLNVNVRNKVFDHYLENYDITTLKKHSYSKLQNFDVEMMKWYLEKLINSFIEFDHVEIFFSVKCCAYLPIIKYIDEYNLSMNLSDTMNNIKMSIICSGNYTYDREDYPYDYMYFSEYINQSKNNIENLDNLIRLHTEKKVIINIDRLIFYVIYVEPIEIMKYLYNIYAGILFSTDDFIMKIIISDAMDQYFIGDDDSDSDTDVDADIGAHIISRIRFYNGKINWFIENNLSIVTDDINTCTYLNAFYNIIPPVQYDYVNDGYF